MRRIMFLSLMIFLATGGFCQIDISLGIQVGGGVNSSSIKNEIDADNYSAFSNTDTLFSAGAFVDAVYVRFSISYTMSLERTSRYRIVSGGEESESGTIESDIGYSWTMLDITLLGKYPFPLGSITLWPAAGILYSFTIEQDFDGDGIGEDLSDMALNDFYLSAGCGADIPLMSDILITFSAFFNLNLTPATLADYDVPDEQTWFGYQFIAFMSVGFKI
ncbi:MAG: hypothetical protein JXB88_13725 [Spirochaetales bacterium]|nr:hypothetical protein [Spirochaetales bacterium]